MAVQVLKLCSQGDMTKDMLRDNFNTLSLSNAVIFFCRLVCSCFIQQHPERFAPFVGIYSDDAVTVQRQLKDYCLREVCGGYARCSSRPCLCACIGRRFAILLAGNQSTKRLGRMRAYMHVHAGGAAGARGRASAGHSA